MLILLPPSEGKFTPVRGRPLDLSTLSFGELTETRRALLDALVRLSRDDAGVAMRSLGLAPGQAADVARNAGLPEAATATAGRVYTGVLYDSLGLETLSTAAKRRAASRLAICSGLFGLLRVGDRIPWYRLPGGSSLPGVGTVASAWREPLGAVLTRHLERELVVDLRSGTYAGFWRAPVAARRFVTVRVLQEVDGVRSVVSHFNKATKGRLVRGLLEDGAAVGSIGGLAGALTRLGWHVERASDARPTLDVVVADLH